MRLKIAALAVLSSLAFNLQAAPAVPQEPLHAQFLPPDELNLREGRPEQQQLLQVTEYSVVVGNQRSSNQQPIPVTAPVSLRLKGKTLIKGAALNEVFITFDAESKSLKKPAFDPATRILTLNYPDRFAAQRDPLRAIPQLCQRACLGRRAHRRRTRALSRGHGRSTLCAL
jgi:hypothetical protein